SANRQNGPFSRTIWPPARASRNGGRSPGQEASSRHGGSAQYAFAVWVASISRHFGFDFFRPFVDAADEVLRLAEAQLPKEVRDASGTDSGLTVHDNLIRGVQLIHPSGDLSHRHQDGPIEVGDLPLHRFAKVQEDAEHARLGTGRYKSRRRRLGIQAAVARSFPSVEDARLSLETEDRAVHVGLFEQHGRVVN